MSRSLASPFPPECQTRARRRDPAQPLRALLQPTSQPRAGTGPASIQWVAFPRAPDVRTAATPGFAARDLSRAPAHAQPGCIASAAAACLETDLAKVGLGSPLPG